MSSWLEIGLSNALLATGLAAVVWVVTRFCRHPKVVFVLWLLVLARLLAPPVWGIPWHAGRIAELAELIESPADEAPPAQAPPAAPLLRSGAAPGASAASGQTATKAAFPVLPSPPAPPTARRAAPSTPEPAAAPAGPVAEPWQFPSLPALVGAVWMAGSLSWLLLAAVRIVRFRRALARARSAPVRLQSEVAQLAQRMGLRRAPAVRLVDAVLPPLVWSLERRATVVLPAALVERLPPDELATLLAHELAHLKRRDHFVRLLEMAALCVYWWHPVAWLARRQLERAGELCCDAAVVARFPKLARQYAGALLATIDFLADRRPAVPIGSSGISQAPLLRRRLEMILRGTVLRRVNWPLRLALAALAVAALPWSVYSVSAAPQEFVPKRGTIEQRLDRLEKAMQDLTREIRAMREANTANAPATVVKTVPENGDQSVDPNLKQIKVTFSKDMQDGSWSWVGGGETFPETTGKPRYLKDKRTCVLPVKLEPGKTYHIGINSGRFVNFMDANGISSVPFGLSFKTK